MGGGDRIGDEDGDGERGWDVMIEDENGDWGWEMGE